MGMSRVTGPDAEAELLIERVVSALASEFTQRQLPRALAIQAELSAGDALSAEDAAFLADMQESLASTSELLDGQPELAALHRCAASLYDDIMTEAFVATRLQQALAR
jgi:hypothetical protein